MLSSRFSISKFVNFISLAVLVTLLASSCATIVKNYPKGRPFVYKTNINVNGNFTNTEKADLESRLKGQLDDSMRPRAVSKVFWSVMKNPPVYDSANAERSIIFMKALLRSLGYFRDSINYNAVIDSVKADQLRTTVNFNVDPGKVVRIDSFSYNIRQEELQSIALANQQTAYIKKGDPFAKGPISIELDRLVDLYRNSGYMRFSREVLIGLWDTLDVALLEPSLDPFEQLELLERLRARRENPTANLEIRLKPGFDSSKLFKYFIGDVILYPDLTFDTVGVTRKETMIDGLKIISYQDMFKPRIFPQNIYFRRGDLYDQRQYFKTINRINALGAWRLVNIEQMPRGNTDTADLVINLTPAKKYSFSANLEGSRNQSFISGNLFGIALNVGLQNRNFGRAANQANTNIRYGIELSDSSFIQTQQIVVSHNIYFPRPIPNWGWIPARFRDNTRTILAFNAGNTERKDLFNLTTLNGSWGYEFQTRRRLFNIRIPNIEYSYLKQRQRLTDLILTNPALKNVFTDGLISSILGSFSWNNGNEKRASVARLNAEVPFFTGLIKGNKFLDTNLYRFIKMDGEYTRKINIGTSAIAMRLFAGAGYELNTTVNPNKRNNLPFFKQYFAGGPNSMRAWPLRRLGPGSSTKPFTGPGSLFERYGDVQIEANLEYRFPLTTFAGVKLYGALFTDIGNVWLLKEEAGPPEEVFSFKRFLGDLGVGIGTGLRIDFNFFVIRFDYSYRAKDPTPRIENMDLQNKWFGYTGKRFFKGTQFQLGISYPFIL